MKVIQRTIVSSNPPKDKNVTWIDTSSPDARVEKIYQNGEWLEVGAAQGTLDYTDLENKPKINSTELSGNKTASELGLIAVPTNEGTNGQLLQSNGDGTTTWVTPSAGTTPDASMSTTSTNAVQNKVITSELDKYAKTDGYYSTLTAGSAENLVGQTVDSEAYLIRPTGGAENEVANGVASVLGMEGNSCVWNQLLTNFRVVYGSATIQNNMITINGEARVDEESVKNIIGHKYLVRLSYNSTINGTISLDDYLTGSSTETTNIPSDKSSIAYINTATRARTDTINISCTSYTSGTFVGYLNLFDLTLMGIDNLTTVPQVEAWLSEHIGLKPYYGYNPGTILSAQTTGIKTYGQNLLNPTTKQAKLIPYTWVENGTTYSNQYTIKNVPSGATATYTPDATGVAETVDISDGSLDITSYGSGILELSAATADTYVCIKWDEQKDDDIVPYEDHTYDFDVRKVYGKNNGVEYQCYPNGMNGIDTNIDTLIPSKAIRKIEIVNLGNLTWTKNTSSSGWIYYQATLPNFFIDIAWTALPTGILCEKYILVTPNASQGVQNTTRDVFSVKSSYIYIAPLQTYSTETEFKSAMNGVMLGYKRSTSYTYTDLIYRDGGIDRPLADVLFNIEVNNWSMEEQLLTPYDNGNPTSIPATIKTQYGMDAVEAIDTLQKTCYFADDVRANLQALLTCVNTNCAETLGGTFSISETATDKVFEFTFTTNNEGE